MRASLVVLALLAAVPAAVTAPVPAANATACSRYAPGTKVSHQRSQQVMVADRTSGTTGTWARWEWRSQGGCWVRVDTPAAAKFGRGGVVSAAVRRQHTATTPAGTFDIKYTFGEGNPGTRMAYRTITARSVWVDNPRKWDYNRWRENSTLSGRGIGENLSYYRDIGLYRQAAVIGYNYDKRIRYGKGSGAGIFLHYAPKHTGGCVGLDSQAELRRTIVWLNPAKHPVIVIKA